MNLQTSRDVESFLDRTSRNPSTSIDILQRQKRRARLRLSRRRFIGQTAGAAGAVLGASALLPRMAMAGNTDHAGPVPIPYGVNIGGVVFSLAFFGPTIIPGVIGDFNGFVGVADVRGTGTATYSDGSSETLLYDTDMRFMQGVYQGKDGKVHQGTFGFVWLDLYRGQYDFANFSTQVHDFNLGIDPWPGGLFWTARIDDQDVDVQLGAGVGSMQVENLPALDYFQIPNGLFHFNPPVPATVSFDIKWNGPVTDRSHLLEADNQAVGDFVLSQATMTWSAETSTVKFISDPNGTSSVFAQLGRMRNGRFFGGG